MASRHLARAARSPDDYRARLPRGARPRGRTGRAALARHRVRPAARRLLRLGGHGRRGRHGRCSIIAENPEQVARRQDEPARRRRRDRACATRLPEGATHVHRRRLQLRRPHRGRRPAALRRAARRVRGASRPTRRRRSRRSTRATRPSTGDPRPHRGAVPAGLRRAHLLLQDRRRLPVLAQRPPAGVPDGGRPALGAQPAAPVAHRRLANAAGRARAPRARAGATALGNGSTDGARPAADRPPVGQPHERAPAPLDEPGHDQVRRPRRGAARHARSGHHEHRALARAGRRGRARRGRRRAGRRLRPAGVVAAAAAGSSPPPTAPSAAPRSTRTAARSRRPRRSPPRAPRIGAPCSCSSRAGCPPATGPRRRAGPRRATPSASSRRRRRRRGHPRDRAAAPDVRRRPRRRLDAGAGARPRRAVRPPRRVGVVVDTFHVWWDPRASSRRSPRGRGGRIASYQVCDWKTPLPADVLLARRLPGRRRHRLRRVHRAVVEAPATPGDVEVEIFNQAIWDADPAEVAARTAKAFDAYVGL